MTEGLMTYLQRGGWLTPTIDGVWCFIGLSLFSMEWVFSFVPVLGEYLWKALIIIFVYLSFYK